MPSPNSIVVDVGANIGYYSLLTAAHNHSVVGFEINPSNIVRLCESISLNGFNDRIHIVHRGVSSAHNKPLHVYVPPHNPGEAQMVEPGQTEILAPGTKQYIDVSADISSFTKTITVTLDQFALDHGWFDNPDFSIPILKMDIEGHEPLVVKGAHRLLMSGMVKNILTEFRDIEQAQQRKAIRFLLKAGYGAVDHPSGAVLQKYTRGTTWPFLKEQDAWHKQTRENTDLWFQLKSEALPEKLL
jgi:FkbM family methyltransferase